MLVCLCAHVHAHAVFACAVSGLHVGDVVCVCGVWCVCVGCGVCGVWCVCVWGACAVNRHIVSSALYLFITKYK